MKKYHKIQSIYKRDERTNYKTFIEGDYSLPVFRYLRNVEWEFTEKIDGTNIRVIWDGERVEFRGKSDRAQIPPHLLEKLTLLFPPEKFTEMSPRTLYGEGYGVKIQKVGKRYIPDDCNFILFDVAINEKWLPSDVVTEIAYELKIDRVPILCTGTLDDAVVMCKKGFKSELMDYEPEGLVCRTAYNDLHTSSGRIITKLKLKDFRYKNRGTI